MLVPGVKSGSGVVGVPLSVQHPQTPSCSGRSHLATAATGAAAGGRFQSHRHYFDRDRRQRRASQIRALGDGPGRDIALSKNQVHDPDFRDVDADLWQVLEMANEEELEQVYNVLYGRSIFSPLLKSLVADKEPASVQLSGRSLLMYKIEQRFRFLAADSLTVLRGRRPSYRDALLSLRDRLGVRCAATLPTVDLEVELFLAIVQRHADLVTGLATDPEATQTAASYVSSGDGMADFKESAAAGTRKRVWDAVRSRLRLGSPDMLPAAFKLLSATAVSKMSVSTLRTLAVRIWGQHARYEAAMTVLCNAGGKGLAKAAQSRAAVQAAQAGLTGAVGRYTAVRGAAAALNPLMWSWLGLDLALMALGTDYSRLSRAVFELAQIRLLRTHGFTPPDCAGTGLSARP